MSFHQVRIQVDDVPGRLGRVAAALGGLGVNILDVDVHTVVGETSVDQLVVELTQPVDLPALEHVVSAAGGTVTAIVPVDEHDLRDRATTVLDLAASLVDAEVVSGERLQEELCRLVGADLCWISRPAGVGEPLDLVRRVAETGAPAQANAPVKRLPHDGCTWWLAVPFDEAGRSCVVVVIRRRSRFTFTETARVQALLRLVTAAQRRRAGQPHSLPDRGLVSIRDIGPPDLEALRRMHGRCSATSLHRRYFSPLASAPERVLRALTEVDGSDRVGIMAAIGDEIIGVAHAMPGADGRVELAFLVEDRHQRRGVGSLLFDEIRRRLVGHGVEEADALMLAENEAMRRLMARAVDRSSSWDGGVLRIRARFVDAEAATER
jgi:GNAT superfamily N-acetyltransferase